MPRGESHASLCGGATVTNTRPKNIAASVHQRLQNKAKEADRSFNELFQYYAIERFLYRLSLSTHAERFVLKGALMLMVWESPLFRSTMDIDVLGRMENSIDNIISIVQEVCGQEAEPDGIIFDPQSVLGQRITEDADYEGVRIRFRGSLSTARISIQLDVGFGDIVFPAPELKIYPTILDFPAPRIRSYSMESAVAEKFEAIVAGHNEQPNERFLGYLAVVTPVRFHWSNTCRCHHQNLCDTADCPSPSSGRLHAGLRAGRHESCSMEGFPAQESDEGDTRKLRGNNPDNFRLPNADCGMHCEASTCAVTLETPRALAGARVTFHYIIRSYHERGVTQKIIKSRPMEDHSGTHHSCILLQRRKGPIDAFLLKSGNELAPFNLLHMITSFVLWHLPITAQMMSYKFSFSASGDSQTI